MLSATEEVSPKFVPASLNVHAGIESQGGGIQGIRKQLKILPPQKPIAI